MATGPSGRSSVDPAIQSSANLSLQLERRIASAVNRAWFAMLWEDLWPRLIWPIGIIVAFLSVSWLGLWLGLTGPWRIGGVALFGIVFLGSLVAFRGFCPPSRLAALGRVEVRSGYRHRPLAAYEDRLPDGADETAHALWAAHRDRLTRSIHRLEAGLPHPGLPRRDRWALRAMLGLIAFVSWFAASGEHVERVAAAFAARYPVTAAESRLDAWVTPPVYTGRAPIVLTGEVPPAAEADGSIRVPEGSTVIVRAARSDAASPEPTIKVTAQVSGVAPVPVMPAEPKVDEGNSTARETAAPVEHEFALKSDTLLSVAPKSGKPIEWRFSVDADNDPTIRLIAKPEVQQSGTLKLSYEITDDYGVVGADARFEPTAEAYRITSTSKAIRPLVGAPDFALSLPQGRSKNGQAQSLRDLTSHPWAGATVRLTLVARDEAGQEGRSEPVEFRMPEKRFTQPLARALIEQRRILALDANRAPRVGDALDALMIAPERFIDKAKTFLGMRLLQTTLAAATTDDDLRATLDLFWQIARTIEDGDLSDAEKALRDAQEALRNALENGATEQEIAKLTQDLREALDRYLREFAQRALQNPRAQQAPMDPNLRTLRKQDLDKMLNRIEDLAKTGSRDAARELLSQLQQMMENLQAARPQPGQQGQQGEMSQMLDQLGEMIQRQQQLMDRTHRMDPRNQGRPQGRPQNRPGQNGEDRPMTPEEYARALKELQDNQGALREALRQLQEAMRQQGSGQQSGQQPGEGNGPGQNGSGALGDAGEAMGDAQQSLGNGGTGEAAEAQGRALDALRQGARQLADQMMRQQSGRDPGEGTAEGNDQAGNEDDPLGRPRRHDGPDYSNSVKVPGEIDVQRARRILEDIRRRLGENYRPQLELDYLERLLRSQ